MTNAIATATDLPTDRRTGLTLPLSKSLGSQGLAKHRAMVALELEVMAKKMDRFGWERDRGSHVHDRLVTDWMNGLQDFTLAEVQEACRAWTRDNPRRMPNEGDIRAKVIAARAEHVACLPRPAEPERELPGTEERRAIAARVIAETGVKLKTFGGPDA